MGQQGGHVGGGEVPDVPDPEAGGVGDLARVDHLTWRGVDWSHLAPVGQRRVEHLEGEVGVVRVVEAGDDVPRLNNKQTFFEKKALFPCCVYLVFRNQFSEAQLRHSLLEDGAVRLIPVRAGGAAGGGA